MGQNLIGILGGEISVMWLVILVLLILDGICDPSDVTTDILGSKYNRV